MLKPPLQSASGKEVQYIKTILKKKTQKTTTKKNGEISGAKRPMGKKQLAHLKREKLP